MALRITLMNAIAGALLIATAKADPPWGRGSDGDGGSGRWGWGGNRGGYDDDDGDDGNDYYGNEQNGFGLGSAASFDRANTILIAHAVIASAVWVLFVPWAALLLRINLKSPIV
jgi:hypothetical protein